MVNSPECHTLGSPVPNLSTKLGSKTSYKWGEISPPRSRLIIPVAHVYMATHTGLWPFYPLVGCHLGLKGSLKHPNKVISPHVQLLIPLHHLCFPINLSPFVPRLSSASKPTKEVHVDRCCGLKPSSDRSQGYLPHQLEDYPSYYVAINNGE